MPTIYQMDRLQKKLEKLSPTEVIEVVVIMYGDDPLPKPHTSLYGRVKTSYRRWNEMLASTKADVNNVKRSD